MSWLEKIMPSIGKNAKKNVLTAFDRVPPLNTSAFSKSTSYDFTLENLFKDIL